MSVHYRLRARCRRSALLILAGFIGVWTAGSVRAQETLSLSQAIEAALRNNPEIAAARHEVEAVASQTIQARAGLLPQIYVSETYNRTNSPLWAFGTKLNQEVITAADFDPEKLNDPEAIDNFNTALSLSWNLFDGGRTWIGWRQAQQGRKIADLMLLRSEQQIIARTAKAYVGVMLAAENLEVVDQALETARAHFKVVEDRFRGGLTVKSDLLRAQVRIADLQQQRLEANSQLQVAQALLKSAMGRSDETPVTLTTGLRQCRQLQKSLATWIDTALAQRPDLKQMAVRQTIAEKEVDRAKAGHLPTLMLQGSYDFNSEDFSDSGESYTVGAVLKMNLYSGQRISAEAAAAKARLAKVKQMQTALALGVRVETQRAFYQAQSSWERIAVASGAVRQAEEGLRIVANRYQSGLLTLVSLLDAQVAHQQALIRHFKAMHDYKVARIELALAAGTLDPRFR